MNLKQKLRGFLKLMPLSWKVRWHYHFYRRPESGFGGPFNGQTFRQQMFLDLTSNLSFKAIVETGTYGGVTTAFMAQNVSSRVYTVESNESIFHDARLRLRRFSNVNVTFGDSRSFLSKLIDDPRMPTERVFFYLDAHWNSDLPLYEEVQMIGNHWGNTVIMIDDFEVPNDSGYGFDDYGNGKKLCLQYLGQDLLSQWIVYFPAADASKESGIKRGCVVLASKGLSAELDQIESLREYV